MAQAVTLIFKVGPSYAVPSPNLEAWLGLADSENYTTVLSEDWITIFRENEDGTLVVIQTDAN